MEIDALIALSLNGAKSISLSLALIRTFLFFSFGLMFIDGYAQTPCPQIRQPTLFNNTNRVLCRGEEIVFGVALSVPGQTYTFYGAGGGTKDGNGSSVSIAAFMVSSANGGNYSILTQSADPSCTAYAGDGFDAYYGSVDDLLLTANGSNSISFKWYNDRNAPGFRYAILGDNGVTLYAADAPISYDSDISVTVSGASLPGGSFIAGKTYYTSECKTLYYFSKPRSSKLLF